MRVRITHSPYNDGELRQYANGGVVGLRTINEGGTHEQNPLGGVPQGYANDGWLNLVEQGEVIFDDYVYSNRLSPSLRELDRMLLPSKYKKKSFADIAKKLSDEAEERPNDPISQAGLESSMTRLRELQEEHKAKKAARELSRNKEHIGANGIHLRDGESDGSYNWTDGKYGRAHLNPEDNELPAAVVTAELPKLNELKDKAHAEQERGLIPDDRSKDKPSGSSSGSSDGSSGGGNGDLPTWMRYAPIAASGYNAVNAFLSAPDHEYSDNLRSNAQLPVRKTAFRPVERYLAYRPLDDQYLANQAAAQFNANRAAMSAGTRATGNTIAGLAALNRSAAQSLGDAYLQMAAQNEARKKAVAEYNRGTDQYNSSGLYQASAANASLAAARDQARAALLERAYAARDAEDKEVEQARSAALTHLANNLHQLGLENMRINMANSNPALYGHLYQNGVYSGTDDKAQPTNKYGGKLSHKYISTRVRRKK